MKSPLSSPSHIFFRLYSCVRTPNTDRGSPILMGRSLWSPEVMPPKRTGMVRLDSPLFADPCLWVRSQETTNGRASGLAASRVGARTGIGPGRARDAGDRLLYVSAHVSALAGQQAEAPQAVFAHWRSAEAWYRDDPSVPRRPRGTPACISIARTSPRRDVPVVAPVSLYRPPVPGCYSKFAWGSGVGSAGVQPTRNTQADGAPKVPGAGGS
jgi:hypothetical protein